VGIDPETSRLVAQCLNHYATGDPNEHKKVHKRRVRWYNTRTHVVLYNKARNYRPSYQASVHTELLTATDRQKLLFYFRTVFTSYLENRGVDGRIILKWILKKRDVGTDGTDQA
jgi:hypothetical protein